MENTGMHIYPMNSNLCRFHRNRRHCSIVLNRIHDESHPQDHNTYGPEAQRHMMLGSDFSHSNIQLLVL
ncbi:hypothetical protein LINPERPRIM_LOCUS36842 [Linum perenne]